MMSLSKVARLLCGVTFLRLPAAATFRPLNIPGSVLGTLPLTAGVGRTAGGGSCVGLTRMLSQGRDVGSDGERPRRPITVSIEGNIGAGKTTLMELCARDPQVTAVAEPVQRWRDARGHNLFDLMYADPGRWSFAFQSYVQLTMLQSHLETPPTPVKVMERSVFSARYCFVENLRRSSVMSDAEFTVLDSLFEFLVAHHNVAVDRVVYLRTPPELCHERIQQRCRSEEEGIPLDYLQCLHERYEDWLVRERFPAPGNIVVLDGSAPVEEMLESFQTMKDSILCKG